MPDFILNNILVIDFVLINIALGLSIYLTLVVGLLSLANAGFMAIGAYTTAIMLTQFHCPTYVAFAVAVLLAVTIALPFGTLVLRLKDVYLAIATLGFGEIIRVFALNGDKLIRAVSGNKDLTVFNGAEGITLPYTSPKLVVGFPETTWTILLYVIVVTYLLATLQTSRFGRVMASIRQDETAAATLGINVVRYKLLAFVLGAAVAAGAGALSTPIVRVIDPHNYVFSRAVDILAYAVLGGMTEWIGPIIGAIVLTTLPEALRFLKDQREIVNGMIIMISIIYLPQGLAGPRIRSILRGIFAHARSKPNSGDLEKRPV
jgi:branched-chain amino acid transport system permease protein